MAADILSKIAKLLSLSASDNEHEARTSALAAARLIREHKIVLSMPGQVPSVERPIPYTPPVAPQPPPRTTSPRRVKDIYGMSWNFHDGGTRFPGYCLFCALPTSPGSAAYVSDEGALHPGCWNERQRGKVRPGPAPVTRVPRPPTSTDNADARRAEAAAIDDLWERIGFEK